MNTFQRYNNDAFFNGRIKFMYYDHDYGYGQFKASAKSIYNPLFGVTKTGHLHFSSRKIKR